MRSFTCEHCGRSYESGKPRSRFCSRKCADDGRRVHLNAALAKLPTDACVIWTGHIQNIGYGRGVSLGDGRGSLLAHRAVYEVTVGPVPDGLQLDHLCRNRACVNPAHLEPVTREENMRRAVWPNSLLTHCKRGHEFTPENTQRYGNRRHCKTCRRLREEARRAAA